MALPMQGSPIRRPADLSVRAAPRRISLLAASFFGFPCQGIHRAPLVSSRLKSHVSNYMSKSKTRLRIPIRLCIPRL